ncbi:MAG: ABC transporter, substrate-binding protein (cluster 11, riboflavin/purine nucleoside/unknown) [uncultured Nocardioides sp.]|uniref:ABC transporter substrate-binding protein PnrA-like domain-containing protein n=1 Tax=uncultured Nocardioides sp. TaxID=198441 RepID=A0A6J4NG61_9ACTN|nr:MAG: ABC transporter, substrate-binding protein (cluster 11, riboflavin/purine nucleoside/unknown) [uncultured Nocardioides sp.]
MKKTARIAAVAAIAALSLSACGERPSDEPADTGSASESPSESESSPAAEEIDFKACMVSDSGGFDDKSFNQTSHDGLEAAAQNLGVQTGEVESQSDSEYGDNISALVDEGCNSVTTVGFLLGDATLEAAKANPDVDFSIVDFAYDKAPKNLKGLVFNTGEPSFQAGYLAAAASETGTVGTFGGLNIPTVTAFMEGFRLGVEHYNEQEGGDVKVLGWDGKDGSFTDDFEDKTKGQQVAEQMIGQGADIIFPVAGPAGLGGLQAAKDNNVKGIWVDTDGCVSTEYCDVLLTSVMKGMDVAVEEAITSSVNEEFNSELFVGTLENGGVGLAEVSDDVDPAVVEKLDELEQQIIAGELKVG